MKPVLVPLTVLVAALSLVGCGGSAAPATAPPTVVSSASTNAAAPPATTAPTTSSSDLDGSTVATKMLAALLKAGSGSMDMTSTTATAGQKISMTATSKFVVVNGALDSTATMSFNGATMEVISVGGVMYMKGLVAAKNGKPWVKIDPDATDAFSRQMAPTLKQAADMRSQIELYQGSKATLVGTENGVRHYRIIGVSAAPTQPYDIYLDAQDRPVKLTTTSDKTDMKITYSGFGEPVTVSAPPASQVGPPPAM